MANRDLEIGVGAFPNRLSVKLGQFRMGIPTSHAPCDGRRYLTNY